MIFSPKTKNRYSSEEIFVVEIMQIGSGEVPITPLTSATSEEGISKTNLTPTQSVPTTPSKTSTTTTSASDQLPLLEFDHSQYSFMIDNPRRGAKIGELQILDEQSLGTSLKLEVKPREMANIFRVDEETKEIFLSEVPEGSGELQEFVFNVTAVDANDPRRRSQAEISVTMIPLEAELPDLPEFAGENIDEPEAPTEESVIGKTLETHAPSSTTTVSVVTTGNNEIESIAPSAKPINPVEASHQPEVSESVKFASSEFTAMLPEGKYANTIVQLKPHGLNQGMPQGTVYHIQAFNMMSNDSLPFSIREDTGELIAFGDIDRELSGSYEFIVTASIPNTNPPIMDSAVVEVQILDVNDNVPEFVNPKHAAALASDAPVGTVIANFAMKDLDEGPAGTVSFSLEGDQAEYFSIDNAGTLTVAKPLDKLEKVSLRIVAQDGGRPASRNDHVLEIEIYPQSSKPEFKEPEHSVIVPSDAQRGSFVSHLVAGAGNFTYTFDSKFCTQKNKRIINKNLYFQIRFRTCL